MQKKETLALEETTKKKDLLEKKGALAFFGEKYAAEVRLSRLALTVWSFAVVVTNKNRKLRKV